MPAICSQEQCCVAIVVGLFDAEPGREQPLNDLNPAAVGRGQEHRVSVCVLLLQRRAQAEQVLHERAVTTPCGEEKGGIAVKVRL